MYMSIKRGICGEEKRSHRVKRLYGGSERYWAYVSIDDVGSGGGVEEEVVSDEVPALVVDDLLDRERPGHRRLIQDRYAESIIIHTLYQPPNTIGALWSTHETIILVLSVYRVVKAHACAEPQSCATTTTGFLMSRASRRPARSAAMESGVYKAMFVGLS